MQGKDNGLNSYQSLMVEATSASDNPASAVEWILQINDLIIQKPMILLMANPINGIILSAARHLKGALNPSCTDTFLHYYRIFGDPNNFGP